jgi:transposase
LLRGGGYISECYVPDKRIIELRELVRHRCALVRMRTKLKNKIHGILLMKGIKIVDHHPFSIGYIEQLKKLNNYRIDTSIHQAIFKYRIDNEIRTISKNIISFTKQNATTTKLLMTIPGISYYSALLVMSEIGNINRFPDSSHLCSYAGLIPHQLIVLVE